MRFMAVVPDVLPVVKEDVIKVVELSLEYPQLPTRDLVHVAVMLRHGLMDILSADMHFDIVTEVRRIDPVQFSRST